MLISWEYIHVLLLMIAAAGSGISAYFLYRMYQLLARLEKPAGESERPKK